MKTSNRIARDLAVFLAVSSSLLQTTESNGQNISVTFALPVTAPWYDTGISVSAGNVVMVSASGSVYIGWLSDASLEYETPAGCPGFSTSAPPGPFLAPDLPAWSLIGRIGPSGAPFEIGTGVTFTAPTSGELYLSMNDNYFDDNYGSWTVEVTIIPELSLTPAVATNTVGQTHTVTACITDNDVPIINQSMDISVTGANTASGTCVSDTSGCCSFSYVGTSPGDDMIMGIATVGSVTVTQVVSKTWAYKCPLSHGFWKNHPSAWPVTLLTLGSQTYTQAQLLKLLGLATTGDASLILADQLIAAKLGIAHVSDPAPVASTIAHADSLLSGFSGKLPYKVKTTTTTGKAMISDASVLDSYNNGVLTPNCIQ